MTARRHVRRPPDLTSLFDVLFIVVFVALIRAAGIQRAAESPSPPPPSAPAIPPPVQALQHQALAQLASDLAGRTPVVVRISRTGSISTTATGTGASKTSSTSSSAPGSSAPGSSAPSSPGATSPGSPGTSSINAIEVGARRIALDAPLLEHSPDPDVVIAYLGDRSAELRVCRIVAVHLGVTELSRYLVIIAPVQPLADLPHALEQGLARDMERCLTDQRGIAVLVDPSRLPLAMPAGAPPAPAPPGSTP